MAITQSYVDYGAGSDATGDGAIGTPWKTLQWAFDHLTRNTTDGNQVNLKSGTPHVNAAALSLTTFIAGGALSLAAPLIVRGYTAAANDGGIGEIDCNGATMWAAATYDYIILRDLKIHNGGDNNLVEMDDYCVVFRCEMHKGASSPSGKYLLSLDNGSKAIGCYLHDPGGGASRGINGSYGGMLYGNYVDMGASSTGTGIYASDFTPLIGNIVVCGGVSQKAIYAPGTSPLNGNTCYSSVAATGIAITIGTSNSSVVMNNIIVGWSGLGNWVKRGKHRRVGL